MRSSDALEIGKGIMELSARARALAGQRDESRRQLSAVTAERDEARAAAMALRDDIGRMLSEARRSIWDTENAPDFNYQRAHGRCAALAELLERIARREEAPHIERRELLFLVNELLEAM